MLDSVKYVFAALWFSVVLFPTVIFGAFMFLVILIKIVEMYSTGCSSKAVGMEFFLLFSVVFFITNLFFRRSYEFLDKLYPFSIFALCDFFIVSVSEVIMSYGYEVMDTTRHVLTIIAIILQILLCRIIMGFYFKKHPFN